MSTAARVWFHRSRAIAWAVVGVASFLFGWQNSVVLVWIASLYANVSTDWGNGEAADDHEVTERLDRIEALLKKGIAPMPSIKYRLKAEFEDGTELVVTADQRDVAAWEMQEFGTSGTELGTRAYSAFRWLAWHALRRQELIENKLTWSKFSRECVEVGFQPDEASSVDPTQPDRPAEA